MYITPNYIQPKYVGDLRPIVKNISDVFIDSLSKEKIRYTPSNLENIDIPEFLSEKKMRQAKDVIIHKFIEHEVSPDEIIIGVKDRKYISSAALISRLKDISYTTKFPYYFNLIENIETNSDLIHYSIIGGALNKIKSNDRIFELNQEIYPAVRYDGSFWFHEYESLGIYSYGSTVTESLDDFSIQFDAVWTYFGNEDDSNLTSDAQELKQRLLALIDNIAESK